MANAPIELLDIDVFHDTNDFGVSATVLGVAESGLFDKLEIDDGKIYGTFPTFRCVTRFDEGSIITIGDDDYSIEAVRPLEFGEFLHILKST